MWAGVLVFTFWSRRAAGLLMYSGCVCLSRSIRRPGCPSSAVLPVPLWPSSLCSLQSPYSTSTYTHTHTHHGIPQEGSPQGEWHTSASSRAPTAGPGLTLPPPACDRPHPVHHPRRLWRRQDVAHDAICHEALQQPVQGDGAWAPARACALCTGRRTVPVKLMPSPLSRPLSLCCVSVAPDWSRLSDKGGRRR